MSGLRGAIATCAGSKRIGNHRARKLRFRWARGGARARVHLLILLLVFTHLDRVDLDAEEVMLEARIVMELVGVVDVATLWLLAQDTLPTYHRAQKHRVR